MTAPFDIPLFFWLPALYTQRAQKLSPILPVDPLEDSSAACTGKPYNCTLHIPKSVQLTDTVSKSSCCAALACMSATSVLTWGKASA